MSQLEIKYISLDTLLGWRWEDNPKLHQTALLEQSIQKSGFNDPIGVDYEHQVVVEGHGRLELLERMRSKSRIIRGGGEDWHAPEHIEEEMRLDGTLEWMVPTIYLSFQDKESALVYALAHNRTNTAKLLREDYDGAKLSKALRQRLAGQGELPGFGNQELAQLGGEFIGGIELPPPPGLPGPDTLQFSSGGLEGVPQGQDGGVAAPLPVLPASHAKMVQLFFTEETAAQFVNMCKAIGKKIGVNNVTDVAWRAVEEMYLGLGEVPGPAGVLPGQTAFNGDVVGPQHQNASPEMPAVGLSPVAQVANVLEKAKALGAAHASESKWVGGLCPECGGSGFNVVGFQERVKCEVCKGHGDEESYRRFAL